MSATSTGSSKISSYQSTAKANTLNEKPYGYNTVPRTKVLGGAKYTKPKIVLVIDGGGIRGIIPLVILDYIESTLHAPVHKIFDCIVSTSTGGIISTLLAKDPVYSAQEALKTYKALGPKIFKSSFFRENFLHWFWKPRYSDTNLNVIFETICGPTLLDSTKIPLAFTSYDISNGTEYIMTSVDSQTKDLRLCDALRATVAAPTYFKPAKVLSRQIDVNLDQSDECKNTDVVHLAYDKRYLIDGGIFANNASCVAIRFAQKLFNCRTPSAKKPLTSNLEKQISSQTESIRKGQNEGRIKLENETSGKCGNRHKDIIFLSLGTGAAAKKSKPTKMSNTGTLMWLSSLYKFMLASESEEVIAEINSVVDKSNFFRIQGTVRNAALDDASAKNMAQLEEDAFRILEANNDKLNNFLDIARKKLEWI